MIVVAFPPWTSPPPRRRAAARAARPWTSTAATGAGAGSAPRRAPGEPQVKKSSQGPYEQGDAFYGSQYEDEFYGLSWVDLSEAPPPDQLEGMFDSLARGYEGELARFGFQPKVAASSAAPLGRHPGREVVYDGRSGSFTFVARWHLVGTRLYHLRTGVHAHHHGKNDTRFLASFSLLEGEAK